MKRRPILAGGLSIAAGIGASWLLGQARRAVPFRQYLPGTRLDWRETPYGRACLYRQGQGRIVLLLHSFNAAAGAHELAPLINQLAQYREVVALDWPGFGRSARSAVRYDAAGYRTVLRSLLDQLAPAGEPVDVVALSLAGQYVARLAAEEPGRFGRLALLSPTGFGRFGRRTPNERRARWLRSAYVGQAAYSLLTTRPSLRWFLRRTFTQPERLPHELLDAAWDTSHQRGARFAPASFIAGLLDDPDAPAAYAHLTTPTLLLFGDQPRFSDPASARQVAAGNRRLIVRQLSDCGDLPQFEQREETARLVSAFLVGGALTDAPAERTAVALAVQQNGAVHSTAGPV